MEQEKISQLLGYLKSLGFEGDQLEKSLRYKVSMGHPIFHIDHNVSYGNELMHYKLLFAADPKDGDYALTQYTATYRDEVRIDHNVFNGIDTRKLEEDMRLIKWESYFTNENSLSNTPQEIVAAQKCMHQIAGLGACDDIGALEIQQQLIFKYWPRHMYEMYRNPQIRHMELEYERQKAFEMSNSSICNAPLAYHKLSGHLDHLIDLIGNAELEGYMDMELYEVLERHLSKSPGSFDISCSHNTAEGLLDYSIPVQWLKGEYEATVCQIVFTPYPEIEHGVYNGIDSAVLEKMMQEINWRDDSNLFIFHSDREPGFMPRVSDVQEQIYRLSQDMVGSGIADQLQLKYWTGVTFFDGVISQTAWDELERMPKMTAEFLIDYTVRSIYNLMCGRAVMDKVANAIDRESGAWLRLRHPDKHKQTTPSVRRSAGFTLEELQKRLDMLAIPKGQYYAVRNAIRAGDRAEVTMEDGRKLLLEANPEQGVLDLYTTELDPIPFNFKLDSEWKPTAMRQSHSLAAEEKQNEAKLKPRNIRKQKGRGI